MKQFKVLEGATNQIDTRDRLKSIRIQADKCSTFIYQREIKKFKKKRKEREIKKKQTYNHTKMDRQMDEQTDKVTYVAGDEVTEFAMIPLNLRQVHFWYSIFEFRSVAGQIRSLGVDTKRSARDTKTSTFS